MPAAADDAAALLEALAVPTAHILGHSIGGVIAQELALRHPQLVRSLSWSAPGPGWTPISAPPSMSGAGWPRSPQRARLLRSVLPLGLHPTRSCQRPGRAGHPGSVGLPPQDVDPGRAALVRHLAHETADRPAAITAPTLVLAGGLDRPASPQFGQLVAEGIPGARLEVLPEEAHRPFIENPEDFNARVETFWREVDKQN